MNVAIVSCFDTFMARQNALIELFQTRGDHVCAFLSDFQHVSKSYWTSSPTGYTLVHAIAYQKNLSLKRMYSHAKYARSVQSALEGESWDLIWVIAPPNSLIRRCVEYKRNHPNTKLIIDINDLWPESFPLGGLKKLPPFQLWQSLRDKYLPEADYIVTECDLFRSRLHLTQSEIASTIYFSKKEDAPHLDRIPQLPPDCISVCYLGSINHIIDIDAIIAILTSLKAEKPVQFHIIGSGESKAKLIDLTKGTGAEVVDHGSVYDAAEKQRIFNQCHFGLNAMKPTVCVGLTMKSIDYLAGGLPLINTIPGDTWELIERYGFGLNWDGKSVPAWPQFDQRAARRAARRFFEQELDFKIFCQKVESVLAEI